MVGGSRLPGYATVAATVPAAEYVAQVIAGTRNDPVLSVHLKDGWSDLEVEAKAREKGLIARAISPLYRSAPARSGLLLGFTGFPASAMDAGVARLAAALA